MKVGNLLCEQFKEIPKKRKKEMKKKERQRERRKEIETIYKGMPKGKKKKRLCYVASGDKCKQFLYCEHWSPQGSVKKKN